MIVMTVLVALAACGERALQRPSAQQASFGATELVSCAGDSLRPVVAAPAQGLWISEPMASDVRVSVLIGESPTVDSGLTITRSVESIEVRPTGDTVRARVASVSVSLERLPPPASALGGSAGVSAVGSRSAAVYVLSPEIRLAAYEPCATSSRAPRVRYIRRDADGLIVADVMLRRASN